MKRLLFLAALAAMLLAAAAAEAHPLGNFTINQYSRIELSGDRTYVLYVLDMAEIPTFQAQQAGVNPDAYAGRIAANLRLILGGRRGRLVPVRRLLAFPKGAGGLRTMRLEVVFAGPIVRANTELDYRDGNYAGRIGWKEIVVRARRGARLSSSTAPAASRSDELRAYPEDLLQSPLDVTSATATVEPGPGPGPPPALAGGTAPPAPERAAESGFASLLGRGDLGLMAVLASLGVAFAWGAAHALSPGHGKAIVTAYLVGQRGTPRHAVLLGLIVTAAHTVSVFALGLVTLTLSEFVVPERLYPWLNLVAGLLVVAIGGSVLRARWRHRREHRHGHLHHHEHEPLTGRGLLAVGVSGGLLPCPSALVVLLAAISLHRVGFGLLLIVAFSAGLALTITVIGLVAVRARQTFGRLRLDGRVVRLLPVGSALVIVTAGIAIAARALPEVA
ncbi:MAG TPA: sulfite exporter TauE/SafE family protein [Solirubrobacteraceae bacterium]|nr:sulfite exporter TauE/SafE family protein [Solirubrobacteraceae bacterium]